MKHNRKILFFSSESWPTHRADVASLFGKYLPRNGVYTDLVTSHTSGGAGWPGGDLIASRTPQNRAARYLWRFAFQIKNLARLRDQKYAAIQIRDMPIFGLFGALAARVFGKPFFYWMSYPYSEGQIERARAIGVNGGIRYWFLLTQGHLGAFLLYRLVLPMATHVFVQSDRMLEDVAEKGIARSKMTPVHMAVDFEDLKPDEIRPVPDPNLDDRRVVVYLGTLDRARQIEKLFGMLKIALQAVPNLLLLIVGDVEEVGQKERLQKAAEAEGVAKHILWTGWLPMHMAWKYVRAAEVGLSPFPRSFILDSASPTKAIEYMALGIPVLCNDNPDQEKLINNSKAGICKNYAARDFADGLVELLTLSEREREEMSARGKAYARQHRDYKFVAHEVAGVYRKVLGGALEA